MAKNRNKSKLASKGPREFYAKVRANKNAGFSTKTVRQAEFDADRREINRKRRKK